LLNGPLSPRVTRKGLVTRTYACVLQMISHETETVSTPLFKLTRALQYVCYEDKKLTSEKTKSVKNIIQITNIQFLFCCF